MATDPIPVRGRYDLQGLSAAVKVIAQALNLGACAINQSMPNVPARYVLIPFRSYQTTVALLPAAADAGVGARAIVTDALGALADTLGQPVQAGGSDIVPVYSDGVNWLAG